MMPVFSVAHPLRVPTPAGPDAGGSVVNRWRDAMWTPLASAKSPPRAVAHKSPSDRAPLPDRIVCQGDLRLKSPKGNALC